LKHEYQQAIAFINDYKSGKFSESYKTAKNYLLEQSIHQNKTQDTYEYYNQVYAANPDNKEAFQYLLNTSIARGYFPKALDLIQEGLKNDRTSKYLLLKKAHIHELMNDEKKLKNT